MRPAVILAVAWRDIRRVISGRQRLGLPMVAAMLLLPAGALPLGPRPSAAPVAETAPALPGLAGEIPPILAAHVRPDPTAPLAVVQAEPLVLRGEQVPPKLRAALDAAPLPGPRVEVRLHRKPLRLPGRSLLVALLAISLLIGPLAESLPGEREEGTLETLLSAALSRAELVAGKWLAWTLAASGAALLSSLSGLLTGAQHLGLWALGVPLSVGVAVAVGLWLVRHAGDVIGGAAAPMRVLPALALVALGAAWGLAQQSPLLGAAIPLGGPLLLAGDSGLLTGGAALAVCALASAATVALMLALTASALDRPPPLDRVRGSGLLGMAAVAWWLPVAGPALWSQVDRADLVDPQAGLRAGGLLLLVFALADHLQDTRPPPTPWRPPPLPVWLLAAASGGLLALLSVVLPHPAGLEGALWLRLTAAPATVGTVLLLVVGQEAMFRGALARRLGPLAAGVAWVVLVSPAAPLQGLASGLLLGALAHRYGLPLSLLAAVIWRLAGLL